MIKPFHFWLNHFTFQLTLKQSTDRLFSDLVIQHIADKSIHKGLYRFTIVSHYFNIGVQTIYHLLFDYTIPH